MSVATTEGDFRYGHRFGFGTLHEGTSSLEVRALPDEQVALMYGWSNGCPFPNKLIKGRECGASWMRNRYSETNQVFRDIVREANVHNPSLYPQLLSVTQRRLDLGEKVGSYEPESVPESHQDVIYPMSNLHGYALPRVNIEIRGRGEERTEEKELRAYYATILAVSSSRDPLTALAILADEAVAGDIHKEIILNHILPAGILLEENILSTYERFLVILKTEASDLYGLYKEMSSEDRKAGELADLGL